MKTKKIKLLALAIILLGTNQIWAQKLKIKGSDTCLPLTQKEAEQYMKKHANSSITVTGGGSGVGFAALLDGTTDIAQASRSIKMNEKLKLQDQGKAFTEKVIAYDALAVVVNKANKIGKLTREQLEDIFTAKITNWKQVGGDDMKIILYSRESSSGTFEFFKEHVLQNKNFATSALLMPATHAIIQSVSQTKGAIGYVGLAYVDKSVKPIAVSYDQGKSYVQPSVKNAKNKTYPITRPLFYYYLTKSEKEVSSFLNFVTSAEGQQIVSQVGYIPIK